MTPPNILAPPLSTDAGADGHVAYGQMNREKAESLMRECQAELCGSGVVLSGALVGDVLVIVRDKDAEMRLVAGAN